MFDVKLLDIIQTIIVGVFTLALIFFFYFISCKFFVANKFDDKKFVNWLTNDLLKGEFKQTGQILLCTVLVYFFGIIAGDLTERMTDSNNNKERSVVLKELNAVAFMPSVSDIRSLSLIDSDSVVTTLGSSVFRSYELVKDANRFNGSGFFLNDSLNGLDTSRSFNQLAKNYLKRDSVRLSGKKVYWSFENFISHLYYTSKNWCYSKNHEPLNELKAIQIKIDLSRSIVLLASVAIQLLIILYLVFIILNARKIFRKSNTIVKKKYYNNVNKTCIMAFMLILIIALLCRECFKIGLLSYNKRAFGYYASYLAAEKQNPDRIKIADMEYK